MIKPRLSLVLVFISLGLVMKTGLITQWSVSFKGTCEVLVWQICSFPREVQALVDTDLRQKNYSCAYWPLSKLRNIVLWKFLMHAYRWIWLTTLGVFISNSDLQPGLSQTHLPNTARSFLASMKIHSMTDRQSLALEGGWETDSLRRGSYAFTLELEAAGIRE